MTRPFTYIKYIWDDQAMNGFPAIAVPCSDVWDPTVYRSTRRFDNTHHNVPAHIVYTPRAQ